MDIIPTSNPYVGLKPDALSSVCRLRAAQILGELNEYNDATHRKVRAMDTGLMLIAVADLICPDDVSHECRSKVPSHASVTKNGEGRQSDETGDPDDEAE